MSRNNVCQIMGMGLTSDVISVSSRPRALAHPKKAEFVPKVFHDMRVGDTQCGNTIRNAMTVSELILYN